VAFAVFTALWFGRLLRGLGAGRAARELNWAWCAGIVYSTVAIRQHVALDALAGAVLGAGVAWAHMRAMGPRPS
jgi:membrane-associated phospholipid phosphatase